MQKNSIGKAEKEEPDLHKKPEGFRKAIEVAQGLLKVIYKVFPEKVVWALM